MPEVQLYQIDKDAGTFVAAASDNTLQFALPKPMTIQPSEIIRINTGVVMKAPPKHVVTISTHPSLVKKVCELFPNITVIHNADSETELELAIRNSGRNQVNLMMGNMFAIGYVSKIENITVGDFEPDIITNSKLPQTKPQKKNPLEFEVKQC